MANTKNDVFTQKCYKIRPGTTNLGREYEHKMMALLLLRCITNFEDIWMASNLDGVGAFDDVVLRVRMAGDRTATYLIQLKHRESSKPVAEKDFLSQKGDFSLSKYANDVAKIQEDVPADLGRFSDLHFVIFTNSGVNRCAYLEKNASKDLLFLNTGKGSAGMYRFSVAKMPSSFEHTHAEHYARINFFAGQVYAKHLDKYIEEELEKVLRHLQVASVDSKSLTREFIAYVTNWAKGGLGGYYYLTKRDVVAKLTDDLLSYYEFDFRSEQLQHDGCDQNVIWSRAVCNKTVTIVDCEGDEKVIDFLKLYVRNEVHMFCKGSNGSWRHKLSDEAQAILFQNHGHLKTSLLQLVGNYGKVTPYDVYKCLWLQKQLSLLLQVHHVDDYRDIHKILTFANSLNLRIIILNMTQDTLLPLNTSLSYFLTISDLSDEDRAEILRLPVKLQGRSSVILEEVADESLHNHIKVNDVVHILLEDFNIGVGYKPLPLYYVQRSLFRVLLKFDVLTLKDEFFAIIDDLNVLPDALQDWNVSNIKIIKDVAEIAAKPTYTPLHVLHLENTEYLKWVRSFGSTKSIVKYKLEDVPYNEVEDVFECTSSKVRLIGECPGMGKSTLMNFIAINAPLDTWVLNVALSEHDRYYEHLQQNLKACDYLNYFNEALFRKYRCSNRGLAAAVFQKFVDRKKVLVLLDGFDEVCFLYKTQTTHIAKCVCSEGYRMWITTRPHMKSHLEEQLCSVALTLRRFTLLNQEEFLTKYFSKIADSTNTSLDGHQPLIDKFVWELLIAAKQNLRVRDTDFTGIPLQTKLLADVFSDDLQSSLREGVVCFNDRFDLVYLYEQFIKGKTDILCAKFGKDARYSRTLFRSHQQLIALKLIFPEEQLVALDVDRKVREFCEADKRHFLQREGLVVIEDAYPEPNINFVHRTFAEYLSAQWLSENYGSSDYKIRITVEKLIRNRFGIRKMLYSFLFQLFDCILARDCPLHMSVINEQTHETKRLMMSDPDSVDVLDDGGRSILHMVSLYGADQFKFEFEDHNLHLDQDDMVELIEEIPHTKISNSVRPDSLGYNPLDNAIANRSFTIANKLCEVSKGMTPNINFNDKFNLMEYIKICHRVLYEPLFRTLVEYYVCYDILFNKTAAKDNSKLEVYCQEAFPSSEVKFDKYASEVVAATIPELLEKIHIKSPTGSDYYDLRFAIAFGNQGSVEKLLMEGASVNQEDLYHNAPLHYATMSNRGLMVEMLINKGAEINRLGCNGDTALHLACKSGYKSIAQKLLLYGADMEIQNDEGDTALLVALRNDHTCIANLLISKNADVRVENLTRSCCLHYVAKIGHKGIAHGLVHKLNVNKQDKEGNPPLFLAILGQNIRFAKFLLENGADINMKNSKNKTCLYYAAKVGARVLVGDFIEKGLDVNKQSSNGNTPLLVAIKNRHIKVVDLLLRDGADASLRNGSGNGALHFAAKYGCHELIDRLISLGCCVNETNNKEKTPLHKSIISCFFDESLVKRKIETMKCLLRNGASVNAQDCEGHSTFHRVSKMPWYRWCSEEDLAQYKLSMESASKVLLNAGADITLKNHEGKTALDLALDRDNADVATIIYRKLLNSQVSVEGCHSMSCIIL